MDVQVTGKEGKKCKQAAPSSEFAKSKALFLEALKALPHGDPDLGALREKEYPANEVDWEEKVGAKHAEPCCEEWVVIGCLQFLFDGLGKRFIGYYCLWNYLAVSKKKRAENAL